jgi:hypothetical protein
MNHLRSLIIALLLISTSASFASMSGCYEVTSPETGKLYQFKIDHLISRPDFGAIYEVTYKHPDGRVLVGTGRTMTDDGTCGFETELRLGEEYNRIWIAFYLYRTEENPFPAVACHTDLLDFATWNSNDESDFSFDHYLTRYQGPIIKHFDEFSGPSGANSVVRKIDCKK